MKYQNIVAKNFLIFNINLIFIMQFFFDWCNKIKNLIHTHLTKKNLNFIYSLIQWIKD